VLSRSWCLRRPVLEASTIPLISSSVTEARVERPSDDERVRVDQSLRGQSRRREGEGALIWASSVGDQRFVFADDDAVVTRRPGTGQGDVAMPEHDVWLRVGVGHGGREVGWLSRRTSSTSTRLRCGVCTSWL
jgi:hypothetical protein